MGWTTNVMKLNNGLTTGAQGLINVEMEKSGGSLPLLVGGEGVVAGLVRQNDAESAF